jgi:hyperosmotically inducible periplasmic protein
VIKLSSAVALRGLSFPVAVLAASLVLSSCAGMLLGGSSSGGGRPLGSDTRSSSQAATDNAISAEVRERLGNDNAVSRFPIRVSTVNRRVSLSGTVDSYAARDQAMRVARGVRGVSTIDNQIRVDTRAGSR